MNNDNNWYWLANDGRIYSAARNALITPDDTGYQQFCAYALPSPWPTDANGNQTTASLQATQPFGVTLPFS
jgi:hypothetical protein